MNKCKHSRSAFAYVPINICARAMSHHVNADVAMLLSSFLVVKIVGTYRMSKRLTPPIRRAIRVYAILSHCEQPSPQAVHTNIGPPARPKTILRINKANFELPTQPLPAVRVRETIPGQPLLLLHRLLGASLTPCLLRLQLDQVVLA